MSRCGRVALRWRAGFDRRCMVPLDARASRGTRAASALAFAIAFAFILSSSAEGAVAQFGSEGEGAGQFVEARGAAVEQASGDLYVVDRNNARVEKWSGEGVFLEAWGFGVENGEEKLEICTTATGCRAGSGGAGAGQFGRPSGVAVDNSLALSHGDVYVVDTENNRVQKFGPDGEFILMFGGEVNETKDEEAGASEAEKDLCTQVEVETRGVKCRSGVEGAAAGEFEGLASHQMASIAVDMEGHVYVGDATRVQRFSEGGVYEETALAGVGAIEALAAAPGEGIYVLSSERAGVREYQEGSEVGAVRDETGRSETIAAGTAGSLFVDDDPNPGSVETHSIRVYAADGAQTQAFDEGEEDGEYGVGWGETAGALYVVGSEGGVHVRVVTPPPPGPVLVARSELANEVEPTTAALHAKVNPEGQKSEYHFEFGTSQCAVSCGSATTAGELAASFEGDPVNAPLSGLKPETTYHFRVVATDSEGHSSEGPETTFTTLPALQLEGSSVADVAATSATFKAVIDPLGAAASWRIEYGPTSTYGSIAGEGTIAAGFAGVAVGAHPQTDLLAAHTYHYRVVVEDEREGVKYVVRGPDGTFTTQGEGEALALPDGRAWELVSPADRQDAAIQPLNGSGPVQAASGGGAIAYATLGAIEAAPEGDRALEASTVISTREPTGWSSRDIATANETVGENGPGVGRGDEYRLFSPDLSTALVLPLGPTPLPPLPPTAEQTLYLRHPDGSFEALVTAANVETGAHFGGALLSPATDATPNLSHVVFYSEVPLTSNAVGAGLYEWSSGRLQLVSVLPGGEPDSSEMALGDFRANMAGAVASEGTRVFWSAAPPGEHNLYMFDDETETTVQLDAVHGGTGQGETLAFFENTSVETSPQGAQVTRVFFTDAQELTTGASENSLYEYDAQTGELNDLTIPVNLGEGAAVQGLLPGVSEDGSYVYVVAQGVLARSANAFGEAATAGADNLYEMHRQGASWQPTFIATLSGEDAPDWGSQNRDLTRLTARASPDGRYLAFMSQRDLTGYDNRDAVSGEADEEVYLYDAQSAKLVCASCNPTGARPTGVDDVTTEGAGPLVDPLEEVWSGAWLAANVPVWTPIGAGEAVYQSRYLDDTGRLFFNSPDALVPQAVNHTEDVYEYEPLGVGSCAEASARYSAASAGCVSLISAGTSGEESEFLDASESGDDVFFLSAARLTPQVPASGYNVYDAHVCGAGWACAPPPQPVSVAPCESASECRAQSLSGTTSAGGPASASFEGAGNLAPAATSASKSKTTTRARKLASALKACEHIRVRKRRAACVTSARKRYGRKSAHERTHSAHRSFSKPGSRR